MNPEVLVLETALIFGGFRIHRESWVPSVNLVSWPAAGAAGAAFWASFGPFWPLLAAFCVAADFLLLYGKVSNLLAFYTIRLEPNSWK